MAEEYPDIPLEHLAGLGSGPAAGPSDRDLLDYYLGPTGIPDRLRSANELFNPIVALRDLGAQSAAAANPNLSPEERRRAALAAALGTGLLAIPAARPLAKSLPAFRSIDDDAASAVVETLTGASPDLADPARRQLLAGLGATAVVPALPGEQLFRATPPVREVTEQETDDLGAYLSAVTQGSPDVVLRAGIGDNGGPPLQDPARLSTGLYSPSLRAVQNLPQERGTYQQLRAQILKGGGKEEELRFAGLDRMFAPDESVTRQQLQEALQGRVDMVQLVEDRATGVLGDVIDPNDSYQQEEMLRSFIDRNIDDYRERYRNEVLPEAFERDTVPLSEAYQYGLTWAGGVSGRGNPVSPADQMRGSRTVARIENYLREAGVGGGSIEEFLQEFPDARYNPDINVIYSTLDEGVEARFDVDEEVYRALEYDFILMSPEERAEAAGYGFSFQPGDTQYAQYMTPGLVDYRERRYAFTDPGGVTAPGELRGIPSGHFERDETRNFVHTRSALGYTPGAGNPNTYVLGEVQSDTAQGLRNAYSQLPEETLEDRAVIAAASPLPGDITPEDWRLMQRMPDDYLPGLRGNVVEQLSMNPDSPLSLEDYQSAVALAQGVKRNRIAEAGRWLRQYLERTAEAIEEQYEMGLLPQQTYDTLRSLAEEDAPDRLRQFGFFAENPENTYTLLSSTYIPDAVRDRIRRGEWLSEDEIQALYSEGERVPVAVDMMQTLAQRGVNPDTYQALIASGRMLNQTTRSPQPYVGSTNRWVDFALKSELVNAANENVPFFAISNPDMVRRATHGSEEGQGEFYGRIVPLRLQNVLRRLDKNIVTAMDLDEARRLRGEGQVVLGPMFLETADGTESVIGINLTPELKRRILGEEGPGLSSYAKGGIVSLFANRA